MTDPEKIRAVMKALKMNQMELATRSGVAQSLISDVVNAKRKATYHLIKKIAAATNLNQDWWFNQRGKMFNDKDIILDPQVKDERIRMLAEQNEILRSRITDLEKIIELLQQRTNHGQTTDRKVR